MASKESSVADEACIGVQVKKVFEPFGLFGGSVVSHDAKEGLWLIRYDDGDEEEVDQSELQVSFPAQPQSPSRRERERERERTHARAQARTSSKK
jgi:hypothetical protein